MAEPIKPTVKDPISPRPTLRTVSTSSSSRLLRTLQQHAIQVGYEWLYLDTKDDLENAIRFYKRHGYECCGRYNNNPQATIFMRKQLSAALPENGATSG